VNRTYRYFSGEPLYPFGYGLTYGDVSVKSASVQKTDAGYAVTAEVINAGKADTQDVVQVYCQNEGSANAPLHPRLCAFQRVCVKAGETVKVTLHVDAKQLLVVNDQGGRVSEGKAVFYAGMGQPDALTKKLTGHEAVRIDTL